MQKERKNDWFHVEINDKVLNMLEDDNDARRLLPHCTWGRLCFGELENLLNGSLAKYSRLKNEKKGEISCSVRYAMHNA